MGGGGGGAKDYVRDRTFEREARSALQVQGRLKGPGSSRGF